MFTFTCLFQCSTLSWVDSTRSCNNRCRQHLRRSIKSLYKGDGTITHHFDSFSNDRLKIILDFDTINGCFVGHVSVKKNIKNLFREHTTIHRREPCLLISISQESEQTNSIGHVLQSRRRHLYFCQFLGRTLS